ncbi:hypothetical protein [Haloarchaeobius sp. TZWWS8]|uniref:hypothetical protein n=1 Tax=Haloarchaeobius sp. TZWWS8 TaxID=3446121 RepID=UPI003EB78EEF
MNVIELFVTAAVGAVATIAIQELLPRDFKTSIRVKSNYWSNRLLRGDFVVESKLAKGYQISNPPELEELSEEVWDLFGTQPTGNDDRFTFTESRGNQDFEVEVRLEWESNSEFVGMAGAVADPTIGGQEEQKLVEAIRISVQATIPYDQLERRLFRSYDLLRDVEQEIPEQMSGNAYSLACRTGQPPLINKFMGELGFTEVIATDERGLEIETREDRIRVRNLEDSEVDEAIATTSKMVTLFG